MNPNEWIDNLNHAMKSFAAGFSRAAGALQKFGYAMTKLYEAIYKDAQFNYRAQFGNLPGSDSTKRLKKKREKIVMRWFAGELKALKGPADLK